jgi:hypothetical protein
MSRLPDRLPGRVDADGTNHLAGTTAGRNKGANSYVHPTRTSDAPSQRPDQAGQPVRIGKVALERMRSMLSERETTVLLWVDDFRFMTAQQIERLHFSSHASDGTAARIRRRVLERLTAARLLTRTERVIGGVRGGSAGFVYGIGPVGHRLLHDDGSRGRWEEPSLTFLDHTLAIAEVAVTITEHERVGGCEVLDLQPEPGCWRRFSRGLAGREVLKPDLFVSVAEGEYEHRWFIEVDRGTETARALRDKCEVYEEYRRSGIEQEMHDIFPKVLWIVPNAGRARQLQDLVAKAKGITPGLHAVTLDRPSDYLRVLTGGEP